MLQAISYLISVRFPQQSKYRENYRPLFASNPSFGVSNTQPQQETHWPILAAWMKLLDDHFSLRSAAAASTNRSRDHMMNS
jgi:hypothetical protein